LAEAVAAARPDVVHTNNLPGITTAIWETCRRLRVPVVHTIHDYYLLCPRVTLQRRDGTPCCAHQTFCRIRTARLARWTSAVAEVIAVSDHVRRLHEQFFADATFHVVRIPIAPDDGASLRRPRTPPRAIGYLGTLGRTKGVADLVEAAPRVKALGYELQIAGQGSLRPLVEAAAARGDLRYHGVVHGDGKRRFVESSDLAILPSRWEEPGAPPYAVAEWLAAGRPILLARRGGLAEVAEHFAGVVAMEVGPDGIVDAARRLADPAAWDELVGSMEPAAESARTDWLARHEAVYELAVSRASAASRARSTSSR
jgi:glycosyltransferase involved in cell wall biosynthesis